jgi:hypothetical protein
VLHTARDLPVAREVQAPARDWAKDRRAAGYVVRESNGKEELAAPDGSRWLVRSRGGVYGYSASLGVVDEAWGVAPEIVDDGLEPTMTERSSAQLLLASTAHRRATSLYPLRRAASLAALHAPGSSLLMEWSAPRGSELDDRGAWRAASPHWTRGRERLLESKLARVRTGVSLDPDEDDPVESFRAQYLNQWPGRRLVASTRDEPLTDPARWAAAADLHAVPPSTGLVVAVEDNYGRGAAAGAAGILPDGRVMVWGALFATRAEAGAWAGYLLESHPLSRLLAGASIVDDPALSVLGVEVGKVGAAETTGALTSLRELLGGRLVHDAGTDLAVQAGSCRVIESRGGGLLVSPRSPRSDLVRCVSWAAAEVVRAPADQPFWIV